jgi:hypothetical protein
MKNSTHKLIATLLFIFSVGFLSAQSLIVKATVIGKRQEKMKCHYVLKNDNKEIKSGNTSKLFLGLEKNHLYSLTFSKDGFKTKTIDISTFDFNEQEFALDFDLILERLDVEKIESSSTNSKVAFVFYNHDKKRIDFQKY